jgi:hypothetical protein
VKNENKVSKMTGGVTLLRRYFPFLEWGAEYTGKTFDALTAACILVKRAGKDVMGGTT